MWGARQLTLSRGGMACLTQLVALKPHGEQILMYYELRLTRQSTCGNSVHGCHNFWRGLEWHEIHAFPLYR